MFVGFYKVGSDKLSITRPKSVDEALCFGWIDGARRSIDKERYCIRFTPWKPTSIWSAINISKVETLTKEGLMKPAGLTSFLLRKESKSKIYTYEKEPVQLRADFEEQFIKNKKAWSFFQAQAPSYKKIVYNWIMSAKQEATRVRRCETTIRDSENERRLAHLNYQTKK